MQLTTGRFPATAGHGDEMSAVGEQLAVMSLGMSCQTAEQIRRAAPLLREITGDPTIGPASLPFDWLIGPLSSISAMMENGTFFPERTEIEMRPRPYWMDTVFFHAFTSDHGKSYDVDRLYPAARQRSDHVIRTFQRLRNIPRIIAIVSNTQNNLTPVAAEPRSFSRTIASDAVAALKTAAEAYLGKAIEIIVVTHAGFYETGVAKYARIFEIEPDRSEWAGSSEEWGRVLRAYFTRE
jgi:hypothetical protein